MYRAAKRVTDAAHYDYSMDGYLNNLVKGLATSAALIILVVLTPVSAAADGEVSVGTRVAARTHPAVQLTSLIYTGDVVVPTLKFKDYPLQQLQQQYSDGVAAGRLPSDNRSHLKYLLQQMAQDADSYLEAVSPNRTVDLEVGGTCTGWWITPDGYMVTGAHCVELSTKELANEISGKTLQKLNREDAIAALKGLSSEEIDDELIRQVLQLYTKFNTTHMRIKNLKRSLAVLQSLPGGGVDKNAKALPAELVTKGANYPGKDIAVLKVNGQQNLPTLALGDEADVQVGDTLYISGFPGLVTGTPFFSLESKLEPALTEGPYSARRTTEEGVPYIQTQAPSYHGNSGGPVFGRDGKVIGMLIAGTVSESGEASENESFVLPVSVIKEKLGEKNLQPSESVTTTLYDEALDEFFQRHYKNALPKFRAVQDLQPNHPFVARFITDSQRAITAGKDETPQPIWVWIAIGAGLLILIGVGVLLVVILRRRKGVPAGPHAWVGAGPLPPAGPPHSVGAPAPYAAPAAPNGGAYPGPTNGGYGGQAPQPPAQNPPRPAVAPDQPTQYVRTTPSPYGRSRQQTETERELAELRRQLQQQQRPPEA